MNDSRLLLTTVLNTAQMGQIGIRSALRRNMREALRRALESQLREYDRIESQAQTIAHGRGWKLPDVHPGMRVMANALVRIRLSCGDIDSRLAAMTIRGNTRGMMLGYRQSHKGSCPDEQVSALARRLLDCEEKNIQQMQTFL